MMTRHRNSVRLYANSQELEDNVYNRLDLDAEQARKKYNLAITTKLSSRNLLSANWPLWQVGLSIGVSKRVNNSLASDYIGMGESSNDKLLKSYIESHSNVVKLLREIERWRNFEQKITGRKPQMWEHEAWDKVVEYKNIRDSTAKFIVDHRPKFQDRINQMELNYATIAKHSNINSYSYSVSEKQVRFGSQITTNEHYKRIIDFITKLQNELHNKQDKLSNSNSSSNSNFYTISAKESQIKVKELISSINSSYKSLQEDIIENRLEFDHRKKEYDQVKNHHSILKEQVTEAENYRNQLMPEFLKRIYREGPETILEKWQEVILEHGSARLASTVVYKKPQILGKLRGVGFGRMYGITNSRVGALENTMVIGERLRKYESSLNTITENSNELRENNYVVQEESLEAAMNKVILIEPTKAEQGFIQLVEQIITTANVQNPTTQGIDAIDLKRLKDQLDKALIARKSIGQVLTSQDIKETINSAKEVIKSQAQVIIQAQTKTQTQSQDQTETEIQNQAQIQTKTLELNVTKKDQCMQSQLVNKVNSENNFTTHSSDHETRMNKLQAQIKDAITVLNTTKQLPKKINTDKLQEITYLSLLSRINGTRNDQELFTSNLTTNQIKATVVRNFFEIKYEEEINDILQGIWYTYNDDKPMPVSHRLKCQIDASRITKMGGYLIEQMIIDDPELKQYSQLKKLANQVILESIQKYQTREEEIRKALATNVIIQKSASYGKKVQYSIAEQLVDHIWQGGSKQIIDEQFELMKKTAQLEQRLIPLIRQEFKEELLQTSPNLSINEYQLNQLSKDIEAGISFAVSKIRNNVYNSLACSKNSTGQILVAKHQNTQGLNLLSLKDYDKIINQTIDNFNKAQEQLRMEQELQQDKEQQKQLLRRNRGISMKL